MKDYKISVRFDSAQYDVIKRKADSANMTISQYLRASASLAKINKSKNAKELSGLICAINRIGNNVNQIAHILNIAHNKDFLNQLDYNECLQELNYINHYLNMLLKSNLNDS